MTEKFPPLEYFSDKNKPGTVFIVDDEPMVTSSIKTLLELETDYEIFCFNHPKEALEQVLTLEPGVVMSDFLMPEMDGISFLKAVKELRPEATLILLTGYADKKSAIEAINAVGIYRYIEKPWENEEIKLSIKNGLERSGLLDSLRERVQELTETQSLLETYNQNLETLVAERTHDLQVTFYTLQSIFQNTADGIVTLNRDLVVTSMNRAVQKWLKIKSQAFTWKHDMKHPVLGQPIETLLTLGGGKSLESVFQQLSDSLENNESPNSVILKEAYVNKIPVEVSIAPIPEDDVSGEGKLGENHYVLVLRDIVERKEIERLRDDFMSTLTHDLRTPLLAAIQTLGFFVDGSLGSLPPKQVEVLNMLINSNREMLGLVNVLLEVYKYESGKQRLLLDTLDLKELAETVIAELQSIATHKNQLLEASIPEHLPRILADKRELRRVLVNLIGNALNYTQPGGRVSLTVIHDPDWVTISVEDNGRGIPASDLPSLFQRFSQGTSKQRSSGIGLGLYLSRQIVEAHHGTIGVDSTEGVGSRFWLNLPISLRDMDAGTIDLSVLQG